MTTLLEFARDVAREVGVQKPSAVVGSPNQTSERLLVAAQRVAQDIHRAHGWSVLHREHLITTVADEENYPVPADFHRMLQSTAWDRHTNWEMRGNLSPQEWQVSRSGLVAPASTRRAFRILVGPRAGSVLIDPVPPADGEELVYEYVSSHWCEDQAGNGQAKWQADDDLFRLDEDVFALGLLWRAKRSLGLDYADERVDYAVALKEAIVRDMALPVLRPRRVLGVYGTNVKEGSWP